MALNLSKAEEVTDDFADLPGGDYIFKVVSIDDSKVTKASEKMAAGLPSWWVQMEIVDGEHAGRFHFEGWIITDQGRMGGRLKKICAACSISLDGEAAEQSASYIGKVFKGRLYKGKATEAYPNPRMQIAWGSYEAPEGVDQTANDGPAGW